MVLLCKLENRLAIFYPFRNCSIFTLLIELFLQLTVDNHTFSRISAFLYSVFKVLRLVVSIQQSVVSRLKTAFSFN